ncbi:uncharacterized protein ARMOST_16863 [Armillaria ostoyae]|uniref:Uncharacterized protein n=1 Tax=Armillaria ostoyae TaxID=47428 RepID=A0A284RXD5_ARMOS|nr:uncharacterized protein ARMOST_16863 [Armillaria ostoyae]
MSVLVLPNTSNLLSRPPLQLTTPLPWADCYHPTEAMTRCRMRNDAVIGGDWPGPKYRLTGWDQILLAQTYLSEDGKCRGIIKREQKPPKAFADTVDGDVSTDQPEECRAFPLTRPVPSEPDAESRCCPSVSEAGSGDAPSISVVGSGCSDAGSQNFDSASSQGEARPTPITAFSFFLSVLAKCLPVCPWSLTTSMPRYLLPIRGDGGNMRRSELA